MGPFNVFARFARFSPHTRQSSYPITQLNPSNSVTTRRPIYSIYPKWSLTRTISTAAYSNIRDDLAVMPTDQWGWVIYRCSYADDSTWAQFRARVEADSRESFAHSDTPEIARDLDLIWVEDRASLDGASTASLRKRYRAWTADYVVRQRGDYGPSNCFIKIDDEVLQSLDGYLKKCWSTEAFVKIVDADWESHAALTAKGQEAQEQDICEPIDGCDEYEVGWMCITPCMINSEFYDALDGDHMAWEDMFYRRPPVIVSW